MLDFIKFDFSSWFNSISIWWGVALVALALVGIYLASRKEKEVKANTNAEGKVRHTATASQKQLAVVRIRRTMTTQHGRNISVMEANDFLEDLLFYYVITDLIYGSEEMLYSNMEQHIPENIGMPHDASAEASETPTEPTTASPVEETPAPQEEAIASSPAYEDNSPVYESSPPSYESSSSYDSGGSDFGGGDD